jgi:hypothetical protein
MRRPGFVVAGVPLAILGVWLIISAATDEPVHHHDMAGPEGMAFITLPLGILLLLVAIPLLLVGLRKKPKRR